MCFFLGFTDSLVQLGERSRLLAVLYGEGPRPLGIGVRFLTVGYVGRIRAAWVGCLAVLYFSVVRVRARVVLVVGLGGRDPSSLVDGVGEKLGHQKWC